MSNQQDDSVFVRNFSLVLLGLVVIGLTAFVLAKLVNGGAQEKYGPRTNEAANIAPVGAVNSDSAAVSVPGAKTGAEVASASAAAPSAADSSDPGKATFGKVCFACHAQGIAGAPKFGDVAAWESRVAQGHDTLVQHALNGFTGKAGMMPARGGNPTLTDAEVTAAVEYMMAAVGGKKDAGAAPAAAPAATDPAAAAPAAAAPAAAAPAATPAADAAAASAAPAVADAGKGKATFDAVCFVCHTPGAAGAPKFGDKAAWAPRIATGIDAMTQSVVKGKGAMPPKGTAMAASDADLKAAVTYMAGAAK